MADEALRTAFHEVFLPENAILNRVLDGTCAAKACGLACVLKKDAYPSLE